MDKTLSDIASRIYGLLVAFPEKWWIYRDIASALTIEPDTAALCMGILVRGKEKEVEIQLCPESGYYRIRLKKQEEEDWDE